MKSRAVEPMVRAAYFTLRLIFYPIVVLLRPMVPFEPFTVGTLTLSLAQFFSIVLWNSGFGIAIALIVWITGTVLALCFIFWGSHLAPPSGGRQDSAQKDAGP
jgi:hypothetical protein